MQIGYSTKDNQTGMLLYSGKWKTDSEIDWELNPKSVELNTIYSKVDEMPVLNGAVLSPTLLSNSLVYPFFAQENGLQGKVIVGFIVDRAGYIRDIKIIEGVHSLLDNSVIEAINRLPKLSPAKINGDSVNLSYVLSVKFNLTGKLSGKESYTELIEESYAEETIKKIGTYRINNYLFSSSKLGWINCDMPMQSNKPRVNYVVNIPDEEDAIVSMVFHKSRSVLSGVRKANKFTFNKIPEGEEITIIAIRYIHHIPYIAVENTNSSYNTSNLNFEAATPQKIRNEINRLDRI